MTTLNAADARGSDYSIISVLIESDRLNKSVELRNTVTDIDVYEHLDKPYLTGTLTFVDTTNVYTQMDLLGAETVTIKIRSTREDSRIITKRFYVSKVMLAEKGNENADLMVLHLIEDIAFISNLINVNRSYNGTTYDIIQKISKNYLGKDILIGNRNANDSMKVIIPNLNPIEAMTWLKNQATTVEGLPFYLFSTFTSNNLFFVDLGTMLEETVINPTPYRYSESIAARSIDPNKKRRIIYSYVQKDLEDLYTLIQKGLIGSQYEFIDVLSNTRKNFQYDISKDLLQPLIQKGIVQKNQPNVSYSSDYKYNEKSFNEYNAKTITNIGSLNPFREVDDPVFTKAYGENTDIAGYKAKVISESVDQLLKKCPMTIDIPGIDFIDGDKHSTIGNQLRLEFPINLPNVAPDVSQIDTKKSGDYLVFAARHKFKIEKYDLTLSCLKLANYRSAT